MKKRFLITSALPYANGPLHFGHIAGAYLPADCYARYQRLKKADVLYICGSDEYGIAITLSSELAGRKPKEHVDIFHKKNYELFKKLDFSFDHYSRTTWPGHKEVVQKFFLDLYENGYIEERDEYHLYSEEEKKFLADRYVIGTCPKCNFEEARGDECTKCGASYEATDLLNPRSKLTNSELILKKSKHWYMRFDLFKKKLKKWIGKKKWKQNVLQFTKHYIDDLKPRSITRDLSWGVPLPFEGTEGKVLYVWFDAPIGYVSATKEWAKGSDLWKKYWLDPNTELIHFIGKDNIPFHTIFFPAMLMGQNEPYILPSQVPANEFLLFEGKQFSKSENWYIDLDDFFSKYTSCQIRFYLASIAPENSDSEFTWKDFQGKCNSLLLGKIGNFVNRVFIFYKNFCNEIVDIEDDDFIKDIKKCVYDIEKAYENFQLRKAASLIIKMADLGNVYFDHQKPWKLTKDSKNKKEMLSIISKCLECIKLLALISYPIIPFTSEKIWKFLGFEESLKNQSWNEVIANKLSYDQKIKSPEILFKKIEDIEIQKEMDKLKTFI